MAFNSDSFVLFILLITVLICDCSALSCDFFPFCIPMVLLLILIPMSFVQHFGQLHAVLKCVIK